MTALPDEGLAQAENAARQIAARLGLEIVEFVYRRHGRGGILRIDIDRPGPHGVSISDCERMSRGFESALESESLVEAEFEIQVSSPGLDRQLRSDDDLRRNRGRRLEVATRLEIERSRRHVGTLAAFDAEFIDLELSDVRRVRIPRREIESAHQEIAPQPRETGSDTAKKRRVPRGIV